MIRFFLSERRFDIALPMAVLGWLLGLGLAGSMAAALGSLLVPIVLTALWWGGYRLANQRLQRLVETGELRQWFLTGLAPNALYWGLVQSVWSWQLRLIIALYGCGMLGIWGRELFEMVIGTSSPVSPLVIVFMGGFSTLMASAWLLLLSSLLFLAAPVAIQDTLTALGRRERPSLARPAVLSLLYSGCAILVCLFAPLLLVSLPLYSTRSERILRQLGRAPDEYLQRLPALIR